MVDHGAISETPQLDVAALVGDYHQVLYRYAYRLTGSAPDADDLTQQTFLVAQQKLGQLRQAESARSWLFTILRNCYLKGFRRQLPTTAASLDLCVDDIAEPVVDDQIDREQLQTALNALPDEFKLVLMLFYFEERPYQEIATLLEIPLGTVMSRLSRAKAHLRKALTVPAPSAGMANQLDSANDKASSSGFSCLGEIPRPAANHFSDSTFTETKTVSEARKSNTERPVVVRR